MPYGLNHENHYCSACRGYGCSCPDSPTPEQQDERYHRAAGVGVRTPPSAVVKNKSVKRRIDTFFERVRSIRSGKDDNKTDVLVAINAAAGVDMLVACEPFDGSKITTDIMDRLEAWLGKYAVETPSSEESTIARRLAKVTGTKSVEEATRALSYLERAAAEDRRERMAYTVETWKKLDANADR